MIASPCINVCQLDEAHGLCRGCLRTLDEIACWGSADDSTRLIILQRVERRRAELDPWGDALRGECER